MEESWGQFFRETLEIVVISLILALLIRSFVAESFLVEGSSMEPTLLDGERLLVEKMTYYFQNPRPGEVVVFKYPKNPRRDFIKRIVATAGDTITLRDGQLLVNGKPVNEPYVQRPGHFDFGPLKVPSDSVFVLGDNRVNSQDSRFFGTVPYENIKGKAWLVYWPFEKWKILR